MENRKYRGTPREMVDDETLTQLLEESEMPSAQYSRISSTQNTTSCGCRNRYQSNRPSPYQMTRQVQQPPKNDNTGSNYDCGCEDRETCEVNSCLNGKHLAMAYFPDQSFDEMFDVDEALSHGTLFKKLELPFYPACESCR